MFDPLGNSFSGALRWRFNPHLLPHTPRATSSDSTDKNHNKQIRFPIKAACTAGVLAFLGDTAAQLHSRWLQQRSPSPEPPSEDNKKKFLETHDWLRALRMTTYGLFIYGPASHVWYVLLDKIFWQKSLTNLSMKVLLNQIVLGPFVIAVVFAWNSLWQGKLDKLPALYADRALPTLVNGWKFWVPASVLNFGVVPLPARVAFMSSCAIFWNFYLSMTMGRA